MAYNIKTKKSFKAYKFFNNEDINHIVPLTQSTQRDEYVLATSKGLIFIKLTKKVKGFESQVL